MAVSDVSPVTWRKSSHSSGNGECVEVANLGASIGVRDSKDQQGPALLFPPSAWQTFSRRIKQGEHTT